MLGKIMQIILLRSVIVKYLSLTSKQGSTLREVLK